MALRPLSELCKITLIPVMAFLLSRKQQWLTIVFLVSLFLPGKPSAQEKEDSARPVDLSRCSLAFCTSSMIYTFAIFHQILRNISHVKPRAPLFMSQIY